MESKLVDLEDREILMAGAELFADMKREIRKVVYGDESETVIDGVLITIIGGWDAYLLAKVGLGKTLLCLAVARALNAKFHKIDGQPDLLPKDIAGFLWFNQATREFEVIFGPLADGANLVLYNEINRVTPRTQAVALSAMEERTVSIHTKEYPLPKVFSVLATANPQEVEGTYPLPEAQLDRFIMRFEIPYPSSKTVLEILGDPDIHLPAYTRVLNRVEPVVGIDDILALRKVIFRVVRGERKINYYIDRLVRAILEYETVLGDKSEKEMIVDHISPRAAIALKNVASVCAFLGGRDYITPEDVQRFFVAVTAHRTFLKPGAIIDPRRDIGPRTIAAEVLRDVEYD